MDKHMVLSEAVSEEAVSAVAQHMAVINEIAAAALEDSLAVSATSMVCGHGRVIEDIIKRGKRTGQVRCLECHATFDDPYHGTR